MADTRIGWATKAWNPSTGCDRISKGCDHCYALTMAARLKRMGQAKYQQDGDPRTSGEGFAYVEHPHALGIPRAWQRHERIFVNSMSDLFHHRATLPFVRSVFDVMAELDRHAFLVLTKRPKRASRFASTIYATSPYAPPLPNVWLGTSIEDADAERRLPYLGATPADVRWVSAEPLIGPPTRDLADARDAGARVFVKQMGSVWASRHGLRGKAEDLDELPADLRLREWPAGYAPA
jgi:protein gp37